VKEDVLKSKPLRHAKLIKFEFANLQNETNTRAIRKLLAEYMGDSMGGKLPPHSDEVHAQMIAGLSNVPTKLILLAYVNNKAVGMAICFYGYSTFRAAPLINIHDIIVSKSFRGLGIGNKLMGEIEKVAYAKKCCKITLEVRHDNAIARSLYTKLGFSRGVVPMDFMTKELL
jgi:ribosomal protein S18 acetylase RimI-like enzyme